MKRLFTTLLIVVMVLCSFDAIAKGSLREGGQSLKDAGREADLNSYLTDICGYDKMWFFGYRYGIYGTPKNNVGDVYFVSINDYWKGDVNSRDFSAYDQVNLGVDRIEKLEDSNKQTTSSGSFYTYEAKNANKFFFIVRRSAQKEMFSFNFITGGDVKQLAFSWYDEWSYVENPSNTGYDQLTASWDRLKDGSPFPSPHNCDTSLETNHYISLNEPEDDSAQHHNFTAYLYVPKNTDSAKPYVFFYSVKMNEGELEKKTTINSGMECTYNVNLNWNTAFDKYANDDVQKTTSYDTMKEQYTIQRSYDKTNWENLGEAITVSGNDVISAANKKTIDTGLKDFDEVTKELGYTVYYRLVSNVLKEDGTQMSTTTSNVITVNIPGTAPFSLTLEDSATTKYNPGAITNDYTDGSNTFTNTLVAAETAAHEDVLLAVGAELDLVRVDSDNEAGVKVKSATVENTSETLAQLVGKIGTVKEEFTTKAGEKKDATYQLVLTVPNGETSQYYYSNLATIANAKVQNKAVAVHRSGVPDANTCGETEMFHSEISFTPAGTGAGTGYYIYRDGEEVAQLVDNGNGTFSYYGDKNEIALVDGKLTVYDDVESDAVRVGESAATESKPKHLNYAVVHYDDKGNTYGSKAEVAAYEGESSELVVNATGATKIGYSYAQIVSSTSLSWTINEKANDVNITGYEIWCSYDGGDFESLGTATGTTFSKEYVYDRKPQTTGGWVNKPSADEYKTIVYYVKALVGSSNQRAAMVEAKYSDIVKAEPAEGSIFTAIEGVNAENVAVTVANGIITVAGVTGAIEVYGANGVLVAKAIGNGDATEIDATAFAAGAYVVKAIGMKSTKILVK